MDLSSITAFEEVSFSPFLKNCLIVPSLISLLLFSGSPCRWPLYFCRVGVLNFLSLALYCIGFIFWRRILDHSAWAFSFVNFDSYWSRLALYLFNTWGHISVFFPGFRLPMHVSLIFFFCYFYEYSYVCVEFCVFRNFPCPLWLSCSFSFRWGFLFLMLRSRPSWWHFRIPIPVAVSFPKWWRLEDQPFYDVGISWRYCLGSALLLSPRPPLYCFQTATLLRPAILELRYHLLFTNVNSMGSSGPFA